MTQKKQDIIVGIGELLWDCYAGSRSPGGAPANVAFHAKQLGHEGIVCSRIGSDELGTELLEYLERRGVNIEVADVVGAGDAFTAALISSRIRGWPLDTTTWFANRVGALVASRQGAMPELTEELSRFIADARGRLGTDFK